MNPAPPSPRTKSPATFPLPPRKLRDHLGNVAVVVSDGKLPVGYALSPGDVDYFVAEVVGARDFYPFGMGMPGRGFEVGGYRYGFQGMERADEVKGLGNSYDFGARVYDSRVARWWSVDPLEGKYPNTAPYIFAGVSPILFFDPTGKEPERNQAGTIEWKILRK